MEKNKTYEAPAAEILSFENDYIFAALQGRNEIVKDDNSLVASSRGNMSFIPV